MRRWTVEERLAAAVFGERDDAALRAVLPRIRENTAAALLG